jgi:hypothetical protein
MTDIADALAKMGDEPSGETMPREAVELLAALVERNAHDAHYVTDQLMTGYKNQAEEAQAELAAIRDGILSLLDGPWMPTPDAIRMALWPSAANITRYQKTGAEA